MTELRHSLDDATVYAKYVADTVGKGYLFWGEISKVNDFNSSLDIAGIPDCT